MTRNRPTLTEWLGLRPARDIRRVGWLGPALSVVLGVFFAVLVCVVLYEFFAAALRDDPDAVALRNAGLVLAAVTGVPFLIWRTLVAQKQADVAEQALFNDKLKAAADDLHARREIKRKTRLVDADERDFIEDDIVRRVTAIDRLEALAQERPDQAPRITRLLCVYLRHLSKGIGPDHEEHPRADMEAAAQTIGRMKRIEGVEADAVEIDLRGANLAGFDLSGLCFFGADLRHADCSETHLAFCDVARVRLAFANMTKADLRWSRLCCADFTRSNLSMTWFDEANCKGADFSNPDLERAEIHNAGSLLGSAVRIVAYTDFDRNLAHLDEVFGDSSLILPASFVPPTHWPNEILETAKFKELWRAWQKQIGFDPDDPATW